LQKGLWEKEKPICFEEQIGSFVSLTSEKALPTQAQEDELVSANFRLDHLIPRRFAK